MTVVIFYSYLILKQGTKDQQYTYEEVKDYLSSCFDIVF